MTDLTRPTLARRRTGLTRHDPARSAAGYTLIAPQTANGLVYLIDNEGRTVHEWQLPVRPGRTAVILPNGNLGYNGNHAHSLDFYPAWSMWHGGDFQERTPQGELVWRFEDPSHHHDAQWLSNGHLIYAAAEPIPPAYAQRIQGGSRQRELPDGAIIGDVIREVDRQGRLVWEWRAWEHLDIEQFPISELFDRHHWPLINGIHVTPQDTVLLSLRTTSGVVEVSKTDGRVLNHIGSDVLSHQHAPELTDQGTLLVFDNGNHRPGSHIPYSRILELDRQGKNIVWEYTDTPAFAFFTPYMGSAQRLWNGNTFITESATGRLFEVTPDKDIVWEYVIPHFAPYPDAAAQATSPGPQNSTFRSYRYHADQLPWLKP